MSLNLKTAQHPWSGGDVKYTLRLGTGDIVHILFARMAGEYKEAVETYFDMLWEEPPITRADLEAHYAQRVRDENLDEEEQGYLREMIDGVTREYNIV